MQMGELRKGFLEAIQLWLNKATPYNDQVTTLLPSNQQLRPSDVTVKEPIQLKQKDKTSSIVTTLPSKYVKFEYSKSDCAQFSSC